MCGIFLCICDQSNAATSKEILKNETIHYYLSRRGPDYFEKVNLSHQFEDQSVASFTLLSSVLQLRGCYVTNQPVTNEDTGSVLQWNGQIFARLDQELNAEQSDTEQLLEALNGAEDVEKLLAVIGSIQGPWAFTYWDNRAKRLWVGRDILGRRSLCWNTNFRDQILLFSSVAQIYVQPEAPPAKPLGGKINPADLVFEEIPTFGIYCFEFGAHPNLAEVISNVRHYAWSRSISGKPMAAKTSLPEELQLHSPITVPLNCALPDEATAAKLASSAALEGTLEKQAFSTIPSSVADQFGQVLADAVKVRTGNHHDVCRKCFARYVRKSERVGENSGSDRSYSSESDDELRSGVQPQKDPKIGGGGSKTINGITFRECCHASTAILFSGGIDSTVIALLADASVPAHLPIDLLNVAFNNDAPDRETGLRAWEELRQLRPSRKWNFVSIHISKEELETYRAKHIRYLVKPLQTVLDDSIGCAIWFATRGKGLLMQEPGEITTFTGQTRARVVLLGMGADEQLAGYSRHRKAFGSGRGGNGNGNGNGSNGSNWAALVAEITTDVERISTRNLGRDDRITADHGIEARFPFLDESVINFLNGLPVWQKCNLHLDRSRGEKLLLRLLASRLGLQATSQHLKRAIQFGSRIAKLEERTDKGDKVCSRLSC
ncbi:PREDICTED: asparagine synthetase domain-containing protein 1-like [Rhagoletis zephyria]|uniref:asparagine synthetase domain-containing protein 1-like n=1 Tax=Rhagoletis zephyria TaxID=28612 RepID=UPI00081138ED|nr:PREDICTED: asparagine synthetase domain-containing protein 1-like [Rhagoletis zephyria]KAH9400097.1 Asparagine synthetase domain-containing protein 1 [Tyrophagus putrescentiae]